MKSSGRQDFQSYQLSNPRIQLILLYHVSVACLLVEKERSDMQNPRSIWRSNWFLWSFFGLFIRQKTIYSPLYHKNSCQRDLFCEDCRPRNSRPFITSFIEMCFSKSQLLNITTWAHRKFYTSGITWCVRCGLSMILKSHSEFLFKTKSKFTSH